MIRPPGLQSNQKGKKLTRGKAAWERIPRKSEQSKQTQSHAAHVAAGATAAQGAQNADDSTDAQRAAEGSRKMNIHKATQSYENWMRSCTAVIAAQHPMGEKQNGPFQLSFNASLKVDFQGSRVHLGRWPHSGA